MSPPARCPPTLLTPITALIIRQRRRLRDPLRWTSDDLIVAGCRFGNTQNLLVSVHDDVFLAAGSIDAARTAMGLASPDTTWMTMVNHVRDLLCDDFDQDSEATCFSYLDRCFYGTACVLFFKKRGLDYSLLYPVGFFDYFLLENTRGMTYTTETGEEARCYPIREGDWSEDVFIYGLLVSFAQRSRWLAGMRLKATMKKNDADDEGKKRKQKEAYPKPDPTLIYTPRLLITNYPDTDFAWIFRANIPARVLDTWGMPGEPCNRTNWLVIERTKIPFHPYHTFQGRILDELNRDMPLAHYPTDASFTIQSDTYSSSSIGVKRKRDLFPVAEPSEDQQQQPITLVRRVRSNPFIAN